MGRQLQPFGLLVVADGVGSQINSQRACGIVIEMLFEGLVPTLLQEELSDDELPLLLQDTVQSANQRLYRQNQRDQTCLGCTLTAAVVTKKEVSLCNVGNSRGYVLSKEAQIKRKTTDHSIGESLVAAGILTRDDASLRPACGRIYRSLGQDWWVQVDTLRQALGSGESVLLCSRDFWRRLSDTEIALTLRAHPHPAEASSSLSGLAQGDLDTGTVLLLRLTEEARCPGQHGIAQIETNQPIPLRHGFIRTR